MLTRNQKRKLLENLNNYENLKQPIDKQVLKTSKIPKITILNDRESNDSNSDSNESDSDDSELSANSDSTLEPSDLENSNDDILKNFDYNISSVLNGEFFNLYPDKYNMKTIKCKYSIKTIETLNEKLESLRSQYLINDAEIDNILQKDIPNNIKLKILEKIYLIINSEVLSSEYNFYIKELKELIYYSNSDELLHLDNKINNINK